MTIKTLLAAAILSLSPALASASCSWMKAEQQAMSCADGMTFDAETNTCIVIAS